jgi:hypothetical protein
LIWALASLIVKTYDFGQSWPAAGQSPSYFEGDLSQPTAKAGKGHARKQAKGILTKSEVPEWHPEKRDGRWAWLSSGVASWVRAGFCASFWQNVGVTVAERHRRESSSKSLAQIRIASKFSCRIPF